MCANAFSDTPVSFIGVNHYMLDFEFEFKLVQKWNKYLTCNTHVECSVNTYIWIHALKKLKFCLYNLQNLEKVCILIKKKYIY